MHSSIHVGNYVDETAAAHIKDIVKTIFESGKQNGMDQSTIVAAIEMVGKLIGEANATITRSTFSGNQIVSDKEEANNDADEA